LLYYYRLIRGKLHLKNEDNHLHSNGQVKHKHLRGDYQESQPTRSLKITAGSDVLGFREEFLLL
jgi:hypothetical protein